MVAQRRRGRQIADAGENVLFLPGFPLPARSRSLLSPRPFNDAEIVVSVIPSEFLRPTLARLRGSIMRNGQSS